MDILNELLRSASAKAHPYLSSPNLPFTPILPLAAVQPISTFVNHLTTAPVHPSFYPYVRLGALHAARVATLWAGMTAAHKAGRGKKVGVAGDLFGYLVMCWGGGTVVPLLLGQPPSWLLTPTPWLTYLPIYLLLVPTGLAGYFRSTCPSLLFNVGGALVDSVTRGTAISAVPSAIALSGLSGIATAWTTAVLGGLAATSGGILVQLLSLHEEDWKLGVPTVLKGGVLNTLDFWGGMAAATLYSALLRLNPELSSLSNVLARVLPTDLLVLDPASTTSADIAPLTSTSIARACVVLFLAALFLARVITTALLPDPSAPIVAVKGKAPAAGKKAKKLDKVEKEIVEAVLHEKVDDTGLLAGETATPTGKGRATRSRAGTPRKSPKIKTT